MAIFKYKKPNGSGGYSIEEMPVISNTYTEYIVKDATDGTKTITLTPLHTSESTGAGTFEDVVASVKILSSTPHYTPQAAAQTYNFSTLYGSNGFPSEVIVDAIPSNWLNKNTEASDPPENLTISTKTTKIDVPTGYYANDFSISLSDTEKAKIIAGNIRSGVTLLGIAGSSYVINTNSSNITSGQTAASASKILSGYSAFINGAEVKGTLASTAGSTKYISTKTGTQSFNAGYYSSANTVGISSDEQAKIIAGNIKAGVKILGITGSYTGESGVEGTAQYISTKTQTVSISAGIYSSANTVSIHADEKAKIIAGNIRSGVTLLGIAGDSNVINTNSSNITSGQAAATASKILSGYSAFINGSEVKGSISSAEGSTKYISTKTGTQSFDAGYYSSTNTVGISSTEQAKIIAGNIRSGVTLLGVAGNSYVINTGSSNITSGQTAASASKILSGYSAFINGAEVKGTYTAPTSVAGSAQYISTKTGTVSIPAGYYSSANTVSIHADEKAKIIASNIRSGVSILGVAGSYSGTSLADIASSEEATASMILSGYKAYNDQGTLITGSMIDGGTRSLTSNGTYTTAGSGYYYSSVNVDVSITLASGTLGTYNSISWRVYRDGTLVVDGSGAIPSYSPWQAPWNNWGSSINSILIGDGIYEIGEYGFAFLYDVTQISISNSVHNIGQNAFWRTGENCTALNIYLPASIYSIGSGAFGWGSNSNNSIWEVRFTGNVPSGTISTQAFSSPIQLCAVPWSSSVKTTTSMCSYSIASSLYNYNAQTDNGSYM